VIYSPSSHPKSISSQVKSIYIALSTTDCIKAASQYQSKHNNNIRFLVEKHPRLVELIKGITDWLINLNIPDIYDSLLSGE